jgi:hypothetical protein
MIQAMRVLALTFAVLFLVSGGGLCVAAAVAAHDAVAARRVVVNLEAKARALHVANEAAAARAAGEIAALERASIALFVLGGLALLTLGMAVWGRSPATKLSAAAMILAAVVAIILAPGSAEELDTQRSYEIELTSTRERSLMPALVAIVGALTAVGTARRKEGETDPSPG